MPPVDFGNEGVVRQTSDRRSWIGNLKRAPSRNDQTAGKREGTRRHAAGDFTRQNRARVMPKKRKRTLGRPRNRFSNRLCKLRKGRHRRLNQPAASFQDDEPRKRLPRLAGHLPGFGKQPPPFPPAESRSI